MPIVADVAHALLLGKSYTYYFVTRDVIIRDHKYANYFMVLSHLGIMIVVPIVLGFLLCLTLECVFMD